MANSPEPSQGEMLRTVAVARLLMPKVNIQAPPNLNAPYYEELLDAASTMGRISPLSPTTSIREAVAASGAIAPPYGR